MIHPRSAVARRARTDALRGGVPTSLTNRALDPPCEQLLAAAKANLKNNIMRAYDADQQLSVIA